MIDIDKKKDVADELTNDMDNLNHIDKHLSSFIMATGVTSLPVIIKFLALLLKDKSIIEATRDLNGLLLAIPTILAINLVAKGTVKVLKNKKSREIFNETGNTSVY